MMRKATIQTGRGKLRTVYIVEGRERRAYVRLARSLARYERELATRQGVADVAHGFVAGRSPVTMARAHIGYDVTLSLDLADWFDSITCDQLVAAGVDHRRAEICCPGGRLRQGLPTSPDAANIAAVSLDAALTRALCPDNGIIRYTRYADDLTISMRRRFMWPNADTVMAIVSRHVELVGWAINERKTRIQYASAGRRIICGLSVGETDVRATRDVRHRLRACQHARRGAPETRGLAEWAACKLPGSRLERAHSTRTICVED